MKNHKFCFLVVLLVLFVFSLSSEARTADVTARKGFVLGFDAGINEEYYSLPDTSSSLFSVGLGALKLGWGLSENFILMSETGYDLGCDDSFLSLFHESLAGQYFINNGNYYIRPSLGLAYGHVTKSDGEKDSGFGFTAGVASGYEFRLTKTFSLSPEVQASYTRVMGGNDYRAGVFADLRWYF